MEMRAGAHAGGARLSIHRRLPPPRTREGARRTRSSALRNAQSTLWAAPPASWTVARPRARALRRGVNLRWARIRYGKPKGRELQQKHLRDWPRAGRERGLGRRGGWRGGGAGRVAEVVAAALNKCFLGSRSPPPLGPGSAGKPGDSREPRGGVGVRRHLVSVDRGKRSGPPLPFFLDRGSLHLPPPTLPATPDPCWPGARSSTPCPVPSFVPYSAAAGLGKCPRCSPQCIEGN